MGTAADRRRFLDRLVPDALVAWLSIAMLVTLIVAVGRGLTAGRTASPAVWIHLATLAVVLALTPLQLLGAKGSAMHRVAGWVWAVAMMTTAVVSFGIRDANDGGLSAIHLLSAFVLVQVPWLVLNARRHAVEAHRVRARILVIFGLLVAGAFTLPFGRMLGAWLAT